MIIVVLFSKHYKTTYLEVKNVSPNFLRQKVVIVELPFELLFYSLISYPLLLYIKIQNHQLESRSTVA